MIELLTSIGLGGILILAVGFVGIFWLAQVIDSRDPYDEGDNDE
jgi:hypothetical protein